MNTRPNSGPEGLGSSSGLGDDLPTELSQAGAMVDKLIGHLMEKGVPPIAIASALLGGSMGLLSRALGRDALLSVLESATHSVRSGEFDMAEQPTLGGRA